MSDEYNASFWNFVSGLRTIIIIESSKRERVQSCSELIKKNQYKYYLMDEYKNETSVISVFKIKSKLFLSIQNAFM